MIASFIAKPGQLPLRLIDETARQWGGSEVRVLSEGEAVECEVRARPGDVEEVRATLSQAGVDLNLLPVEGRRKRLLIADMDSTMIEQECIDEMAAHFGIGDAVSAITKRAMNGELDFEEAVDARVSLLKGLPLSALEEVWQNRITFMPGGATLLATMKASGAYAALVSGGFTQFTARVAEALGFDEHRANLLLEADAALVGAVKKPVLGQEAKVEALEDITARLEISEADAIAVGDGANDLGMLGRAGLGVALHAKPSVQAACDIRINHGDLTALLYLQGYGRAEFVSA